MIPLFIRIMRGVKISTLLISEGKTLAFQAAEVGTLPGK